MKHLLSFCALLLSFTCSCPALPLEPGLVPPDAKWLVHLDVDSFRGSKLGTAVLKEMLAEPLARLKTVAKVDVELILQKLHYATAYGTDFEAGPRAAGVLVLGGDTQLRDILEGLLAAQILQNSDGPIKKLQEEPFVLYSISGETFISPCPEGQILVSKSRTQIEEARRSLARRNENPKANGLFSGYATVPNSFFLLAVAQGFNESPALPPQAKILKMAEGARLALGEKADQIFLNLALKAKDSEVIQQIRQVLDGMKALVALGQSENKELLELVQSTQVASSDKTVTVTIEYPLAKTLGKLDAVSKKWQNGERAGKPRNGRPDKQKHDKPAEAEASDDKQ